jgi:hypothetical protein
MTVETGYKRYFGYELAEQLAAKIIAVQPGFPAEAFLTDVRSAELSEKELLARVDLHETIFPPPGNPGAALLILRAEYLGAEPERYSLWVGFVTEAEAGSDTTRIYC